MISAKVPVNKKAKAGTLGKWLVDQNAKMEHTVPFDAALLISKEVKKKSEDFYWRILGIK